jgi:hypothetical protein
MRKITGYAICIHKIPFGRRTALENASAVHALPSNVCNFNGRQNLICGGTIDLCA